MANQRRTKERKEKEARPTSDHDKKVDVHLFVVPSSLWRPDLRFAYNTICVQSISCGFVRALPNITLKLLRDEISQQLDCSLFPCAFVFLKSIGKCLTWVTPKQEATLKLRVFLPPLAPCPEIYILDAAYLQLPEGAASLPPLSTPLHTGLGHPLYDNHYIGYDVHHGHGYAIPYYRQQQLHPSYGSHPHSCTPPNFMPPPTVQESGTSNCDQSYSTAYHPLDQIHKTAINQQQNNVAKKKSHGDEHHHKIEQVQGQYLHHQNGLTDLNNFNGSRVHPFNQQVNQSRGSHPAKPLHHENGLTDLSDYSGSRGQPLNQHHPGSDPRDGDCGKSYDHELLQEAPYVHQHPSQSTYNSKISHTSGVKHNHSANRCQEDNEPNKGYGHHSQHHDYKSANALHPQKKVSLRHRSLGGHPSPVKSRSNNQSDYRYNSNNHPTRSDCDSNGVTYDQLSSKSKRDHIKQQRQDQAIHTGDSEIAVKHGADSAQFHQDPNNHYRPSSRSGGGPCNDWQDDMEPNYHDIKGSHPTSNQYNDAEWGGERVVDQEHEEKGTDVQSQRFYAGEDSDQEVDELGDNVQKWPGNQETRNETQQRKQQYNASKQPQQTRKAIQKSNRTTDGDGNRKRSATYPPGRRTQVKHSTRQPKGENIRRSQTNGGSRIPIPGTRQNQKFTKLAANQYPNATISVSRNDDFSHRLPLPPIGSDMYKGNIAKASSTKLVSKSQSQVKRPSTQQTNEILAQIRRMKDECEELSSTKAELSSVLRIMQHNIRTQREQADKEWKRKYFQEKKFTSTLEDKIKRSKDDLQQLQGHLDRKQGNYLKESLHSTSVSTEAPSELSNMKIRCKKNQTLIQSQRAQLEAAKKRLAAERNARKVLENECKELRRELLEKKIACTRTKRQPAVSTQS